MNTEGILLTITLAQWAAGWLVLGRLGGRGKAKNSSAAMAEKLSVIIPARDEEKNLPQLLRSLTAQAARPKEIIVVDDSSTDRTAEIARTHGARVVSAPPIRDGWVGKTWACHQGAQAASGKFFLFLDADTWFEPDGLATVLAEFPAAGSGALSVAPYHVVPCFYEQFSAVFNLVMLAGTGAFTLFGDQLTKHRLLGQFLLIGRASYFQIGGHEAVKDKLPENFHLSKWLHAAQVPVRCRNGRGAFSFRMYPAGWRQLVAGWTKGFASGAGQTPWPILLLIIVWLGGIFFVPIGVVTQGTPLLWLAVYGLGVAQVAWLLRSAGSFRFYAALIYPALILFFFVVFFHSILRPGKPATWKGREIRAV